MIREIVAETDNGIVSVEIGQDGAVEISRMSEKASNSLPTFNVRMMATNIWLTHTNWSELNKIVRSGHGLCGVYTFDPKKPIMDNYIENDTMHSSSCVEWATTIFRFYPELFNLEEQYRIITFLRYHDLGEKRDLPDDRPRAQKFKDELKLFVQRTQYLPDSVQNQLISDFVIFENANNICWKDRDRQIMQFAKLCDKADAPLAALLYEKEGRKGSLAYKAESFEDLTPQDARNIEIAGTSDQTDAWVVHLIDGYGTYYCFEIFLNIIVAACYDVRGEIFPWLEDYLKLREIPALIYD